MSASYRIEKNRPVPERQSKFPWAKMEIGDSFLVPDAKAGVYGARIRTAAAMFKHRSPTPFNVTIRRVKNGYRTWRIAP